MLSPTGRSCERCWAVSARETWSWSPDLTGWRDRRATCSTSITEKGAGFRYLSDVWADTTTPHGRLIVTVLGGLAEFERELIRSRTGEGRARAIANGVKMGRKPKLTVHQSGEARARRDAGETLVSIARSYNVSHSTISRL